MTAPAFLMFRNPNPGPGRPEYSGTVTVEGKVYAVEAAVVPNTAPLTGRHFAGFVLPLHVAMARSGTWTGDKAAMPKELQEALALDEPLPFNDSLEGVGV